MTKLIVITSIFEPSEAVIALAQKKDCKVIVVGDKKTPSGWFCENTFFLSLEEQEVLDYELVKHLPYNHYCRKMIGYLYAFSLGAHIIIDTDDDNIPLSNWGFPEFTGSYPLIPENLGFVNIYELYTNQKIWPRGYPLRYINRPKNILRGTIFNKTVKVGIWQGLANGDPDVDALYRLTSDEICFFENNGCFALGEQTITPFNSQNTAFCRELFVLMYLPSFVSFRFTDILRGLVAQPIMWLYGFNLGFTEATVLQKRNPHDYINDFESEIPMYLHSESIVELVSASISSSLSIEENLRVAYAELNRADIVCEQELQALEAWIQDCKSTQQNLRDDLCRV